MARRFASKAGDLAAIPLEQIETIDLAVSHEHLPVVFLSAEPDEQTPGSCACEQPPSPLAPTNAEAGHPESNFVGANRSEVVTTQEAVGLQSSRAVIHAEIQRLSTILESGAGTASTRARSSGDKRVHFVDVPGSRARSAERVLMRPVSVDSDICQMSSPPSCVCQLAII